MASGSWFVGAVPKGGPLVGIPLAGGPLFAAALFTEFAAGSPRGSPYDCGPWDRGGLRTATCGLRFHRIQAGLSHEGFYHHERSLLLYSL